MRNWKRWGPYLSERQWGTVREDYSAGGSSWGDLPHEHARSRAYRWGEDGLLGFTDRRCRLCFGLALWNGRDPILKERLFGLTGPQGNHGEDVKELYYYLDATPTYSYAKALYKYPQAEFPYARLLEEARRRGKSEREFELLDTGVFDEGRYFDVFAEYAKASPNDLRIRVSVHNRGPEAATLHLLPTIWFRNTWAWGRQGDGYWPEPLIERAGEGLRMEHDSSLGAFRFSSRRPGEWLFTRNETNVRRLYGQDGAGPFKDAFHDYVVGGDRAALGGAIAGTKAAAYHTMRIPAGGSEIFDYRLALEEGPEGDPFADFDEILEARVEEADAFYAEKLPDELEPAETQMGRQAYGSLLWTNQVYHYIVRDWLEGDPAHPPPPASRWEGRNSDWRHVFNLDVISMPDKWEYPWYAAWDLAFHMIPYAHVDTAFAKDQLKLFLREWYMHPNGQIPAYEFCLGDVNPPVHAWAVWRVYRRAAVRGDRDVSWLAGCFQKLLLNYGWWVNRKDADGNNLFSGGFLGLDNIGVFDRSKDLPLGGRLEQADGTAWMAFFCGTMLSIAIELAQHDPSYEDMASRFFEHFVEIVDALNNLGGTGLWDEQDGFYYDRLHVGAQSMPLRTRSLVGLAPLFAVHILEQDQIERLPGFAKRLRWFLENRDDLDRTISYMAGSEAHGRRLLALPTRARLERVLRTMFDEREFLSPYGIRSLSKAHEAEPCRVRLGGQEHVVRY
ncbi:MAG: glucosidase, partial [Myxococcales bacterium]|nr:glucosidase [Myxococcales bacterium]